jgi:hypothetical protein
MAKTGGRSTGGAEETPTADAPVCPVGLCPVGMFLTMAGEARPEVVEHLLKAGRELMLAARALLDARLQQAKEAPRLEKIDLE